MLKRIRCMIIEDEPLAADILKDYISQLSFLSLEAVCSDALKALSYLNENPVDLIFLDIHLPGLKGLDFLKSLSSPPKVILTTAYHEYALQGYELSVTDYLLKPIAFKRFVEAVNKIQKPLPHSVRPEIIQIHAEKKTILLAPDEIIFLESQKEYIKVQTTKKTYAYKYALSKIETEIDPQTFIRIHRSFIINVHHLKGFNSVEVEVEGGITLPIGGNYKELVENKLKSIFT